MFRKLVCVTFVMTVAVGFVLADEFQGAITKIDGDKVTVQKMKKGKGKGGKGEKDGDPVTMTIAKDAKIVKGKFDMEAKKMVAGDAIEGGLKHEMFSKVSEDMPVNAMITTDADNKSITTIMVGGKGGKKKTAN